MNGTINKNIKKIDYKVENGKLIRLQVIIEQEIIKFIKIYGDFFIYPETGIFSIENFLLNKEIAEIDKQLTFFLKEKNIKIIGFSPLDLQIALRYKQ
jgi:effector-binding domain-containing protein